MNEENLQMAFAQIDEDGNGNLTKDELKNAFSSHRLEDEQIWNQFIKEADKDGDDQISYQEFLDFMKKKVGASL